MKKINDEIILKCKELYENEQIPCSQLAEKFGINANTIRRRLKALGVEIIKHPKAGKFNVEDVIKLYQERTPIWKIAEKFNSSQETISKVLKENNIEVIRRCSCDFYVFDEIDTEEKAYWLGFIWADGSVISINPNHPRYELYLGISVKDIEHLEKFCDFMKIDKNKIKIKKVGGNIIKSGKAEGRKISEGTLCYLQVISQHLWYKLNELGCVPNKTYNEKFPDINIFKNKNLIHHFLRGFFDGDGWVYLDNRNYLIAGICGSNEFLLECLNNLPNNLNKNIVDCIDTDVIRVLKWGGTKAETFLKYIYEDANIYLDRKYIVSAPYISNNICKPGNIGENPTNEDNTEINSEIKESESSYSVEVETI